MTVKTTIAIIGSGPAALALAVHLDEQLFDIHIYERSFAPGRKFLVAGDGGFNLTHSEDPATFITRYTPSSFLQDAFAFFSNNDLREWMKSIGIETFAGTSGRVFPVKGIKPIEVLNAILRALEKKDVRLHTRHAFSGWNEQGGILITHHKKTSAIKADVVVFALGGASWSKTGSDGKWLPLFEAKGIDTIPFKAANCACRVEWPGQLIPGTEGKPLKNLVASCGNAAKKGELVITRFGLEGGPVYALNPQISAQLEESGSAILLLDLKPSFTAKEITELLRQKGGKTIAESLKQELRLSPAHLALLKNMLTKEQFTHPATLAGFIKQFPLTITGLAPIDDAISTTGGIALGEINKVFELKKLPHHYAIGEMLDWNAPTGGYLLQASFSMGQFLGHQLNERFKQ